VLPGFSYEDAVGFGVIQKGLSMIQPERYTLTLFILNVKQELNGRRFRCHTSPNGSRLIKNFIVDVLPWVKLGYLVVDVS
jgi:hypothetical protein